MAGSVSVPNGIYQIGSQTYGPVTLASADEWVKVILDRTVNQGMNTKTPTTTVGVTFEVTWDGGASWWAIGSGTFQGGIRSDPELGQLNTDYLAIWIAGEQGQPRQMRCTLTVGGSSVRLGGTVSTGSGPR